MKCCYTAMVAFAIVAIFLKLAFDAYFSKTGTFGMNLCR
jgi:hypothetical protein